MSTDHRRTLSLLGVAVTSGLVAVSAWFVLRPDPPEPPLTAAIADIDQEVDAGGSLDGASADSSGRSEKRSQTGDLGLSGTETKSPTGVSSLDFRASDVVRDSAESDQDNKGGFDVGLAE